MKKLVLLLLASACLAACTTELHFVPYATSYEPFKAPVKFGVYLTTDTLTHVTEFSARGAGSFTTYKVFAGECVESELLTRIRPRVHTLVQSASPFPSGDEDMILALHLAHFAWENDRAQVRVEATLRTRDGAVLIEKTYRGAGTPTLRNITWGTSRIPQHLRETTREAVGMAVHLLMSDLRPYLSVTGSDR
jgi:hypothetical protein